MRLHVPEGTYIELVRSLFATLLTTCIMAASFVWVAAFVLLQTADKYLGELAVAGSLLGLCRILVVAGLKKQAMDEALDVAGARRLEKYFAASYLTFACVFGLFAARAIAIGGVDLRALIVGLIFGYAAGVSAGISYRPGIAVAAMCIAVLPAAFVSIVAGSANDAAVALLLAVFLAGGISSVISRYKDGSAGITLRRHFALLAQQDALTGLANRIALEDAFAERMLKTETGVRVAVHCLDLDHFKPVNDLYGHPMGDKLLQAVAGRVRQLLRSGDFVARVGGDEFVILQSAIVKPFEADALARRVVTALSEPFSIDGTELRIGTSVGYALSSADDADLSRLIDLADQALFEAKRGGRNRVAAHGDWGKVAFARAA